MSSLYYSYKMVPPHKIRSYSYDTRINKNIRKPQGWYFPLKLHQVLILYIDLKYECMKCFPNLRNFVFEYSVQIAWYFYKKLSIFGNLITESENVKTIKYSRTRIQIVDINNYRQKLKEKGWSNDWIPERVVV